MRNRFFIANSIFHPATHDKIEVIRKFETGKYNVSLTSALLLSQHLGESSNISRRTTADVYNLLLSFNIFSLTPKLWPKHLPVVLFLDIFKTRAVYRPLWCGLWNNVVETLLGIIVGRSCLSVSFTIKFRRARWAQKQTLHRFIFIFIGKIAHIWLLVWSCRNSRFKNN